MDRTTLQYRGYTSPAGKRRIDDVLLLMGHLQNALIQHRYAANSTHRRRWSLNLQNAHLTDLHRNNAEYNSCARRLLEGTARRVNKSFSNFFNDPQNVGRPQTKSPYQNHTLEISEPASQHLKPGKHGWTTIHIKGLPTIRFRTDRRLPTENQPKVIRITKTPKRLVVSLVFDHEPKELPEPNDESVGIDPGKKWLLTAKSDDGSVLQVPGIDDAAHQKTMRQLRHKMQRQRDAAVNDGHARWVSQKSTHGTKRRFRWIDQPSKNYLEVVAQLRRVEQTRQDTMRGLQHRLSTQLVPVPGRFVDTGKSLPTVDSSLCGNDGQVKRVCSIRHIQVETVLVREHQTICMEDTKTRNLTRSAKGTAENPGQERGPEAQPQPGHPLPRLVRTTAEAGVQVPLVLPELRAGASPLHQPAVRQMRPQRGRQPTPTRGIQVSEMRASRQRRRQRGGKHPVPRSDDLDQGRKLAWACHRKPNGQQAQHPASGRSRAARVNSLCSTNSSEIS